MNTQPAAARARLAPHIDSAATSHVSRWVLVMLLAAYTAGPLSADDGLMLVPEFQILRTASGEKRSHTSLAIPGRTPGEGPLTNRPNREQAVERTLAHESLPEIVFARPSLPTERPLHASPDRATEPEARSFSPASFELATKREPADQAKLNASDDSQLIGYFYQDTQSPSDHDAVEKPAWTPLPVAHLRVAIGLPGDGPLPPDMTNWRKLPFDPACACPDCPRPWGGTCYCFCATCLCYNPLYFEEINLERYGYGCHDCLQPFCSAAHFFGRVPLLPCMMVRDCPWECNYTLGHYRPGSCNPWRPVGVCGL